MSCLRSSASKLRANCRVVQNRIFIDTLGMTKIYAHTPGIRTTYTNRKSSHTLGMLCRSGISEEISSWRLRSRARDGTMLQADGPL